MRRRGAEDFSKLPIWAQNRIRKLEADVEHYKAQAMEAAPGSFSRICIPDYSGLGMGGGRVIEHGIPESEAVRFYQGARPRPATHGDRREPYIEMKLSDRPGGGVRVSAGIGQLVVYPESSNVARVSSEPF